MSCDFIEKQFFYSYCPAGEEKLNKVSHLFLFFVSVNKYSIIKGVDVDEGKSFLRLLPSTWVVKDCFPKDNDSPVLGDDMFYWPLRNFQHLLFESQENPALLPDLSKFKVDRCKIQRDGFATLEEVGYGKKKIKHLIPVSLPN